MGTKKTSNKDNFDAMLYFSIKFLNALLLLKKNLNHAIALLKLKKRIYT